VYVYIPDCKLSILDLPPKVVPIMPGRYSFACPLSADGKSCKIVRLQLYLEPAFSMTSHGAQGKTMLSVLADITEGV
jgi:hypothetical protein